MTPNINNYNTDELEAPAWLNDQFFKDVLVHHHNDPNVKVIEFNTSPATAKGDHYASVMFRTKVDYSLQNKTLSKSLIIKTMPEIEGHKKEFLGDSHIFPTEIAMYTEILPKFEEILSEAGDKITFCARCIYHSLEPRQVMIFEDLVLQNYEVIRKRPASLDEIKTALGKLAKWQAVSFKLLKDKSGLFDKLQYDLTTLPNFLEQDILKSGFSTFLEALDSVESLKKYRKYFEPIKDVMIERWTNIIREYRENRQEDAYYVLCHGDFHVKNMMFRGTDCMLLDFQMSYVGSITNDVLYAVYMLFNPEDRRDNYDELIYHYFTTFANTLEKIGYQGKKPSLVEFRKQLFDRKYSEIFLMSTFLPIFNHMRNGQDPAEFMENTEKCRELYHSKEYLDDLKHLLPRMLHLGYFEQLQ
ncbi:uncharacterized protein LOC117576081 [Drosophila albomicans]|uniref:Uncharacterized protein LOC117576081 n=1 Tax=Drosophila albomicans TaxID=7291 RepID=A0A6P8XTJ7_DROAB|nr:uncharacterized protein LOC117576081 [Drosophila albomicans]